jgi:hypothetical protein
MKQVEGNEQLVPASLITDIGDIEITQYPWRRLENEPITAYSYFKHYLTLPQPRKVARLAVQLRLHRQGLARYCATYKWVDRAAAYDDFLATKELQRQKLRREKADLEWAARRDEQREQEWDIAQQLLDKVRQMLQVPLFAERTEEILEGLDPQGRIIIRQIIHFEPLDWGATDMARFFEVASKMARLATGMDTDQKKIRIDVAALTDEELERLSSGR